MSVLQALLVLVAGVAAGAINTVVGSGTLITFPTLLAIGLPPVTANVSNTVGLFSGSLVGAYVAVVVSRVEAAQDGLLQRRQRALGFGGGFVGVEPVRNPDAFAGDRDVERPCR